MSAESQIVKVPPPPKTGWPFRGGISVGVLPDSSGGGCRMWDVQGAGSGTRGSTDADREGERFKRGEKTLGCPVLRRPRPEQHPDGKIKESKRHWVRVLKVIDGVTFSLDNLHVVRLIGVARPKPFADKKYKEFFEEVTSPRRSSDRRGKSVYFSCGTRPSKGATEDP